MIKENDCVKIEYNAYVKEDNRLFDTTSERLAKESGVYQKESVYQPMSVLVGKGFVVKGVDASLIGKEVGEKYKVNVEAEKGFGKWTSTSTENVKLSSFKKENINPQKGMVLNLGGRLGRVALVIPGRFVKIDYNHPLAGKDLIYEIKIVEELKKPIDKVQTVTNFILGREAIVKINEKKISIKTKTKIPDNVKDLVKKIVKETLKKEYNLTFT